ncbi:protein-tyrosine-phosphatase [Belliella kenyensis]|uniref:Protein-tyrosine-phosphatase n=1 Tax=Belliella kenyensis TaxID=1472724 RepID=A0ABV8EMB9_9BACT|nr:protein-tyrosine-phosphatase [Belliella kenyensis]MCH7401520.1 protein-tyrosine-phosphatase [Belliella kenyensis]MDN3603199.1 protein-tyrosine-phosphatase [Belliella kenyensis]
MNLYPPLHAHIEQALALPISEERQAVLQVLIDYIQKKIDQDQVINLNFICTHNSRRSQFSQIWGKVAAEYYGIDVNSFSGGVEVTAFNERAVASIKRFGFKVSKDGESNPKYFVFYSDDAHPIVTFSKMYDDAANAPSAFAAIMTCSHADENCPFIPGAEARIPVRYEDPKAFDDTDQEAIKYDERSLQIGSEMLFVFSKIVKVTN